MVAYCKAFAVLSDLLLFPGYIIRRGFFSVQTKTCYGMKWVHSKAKKISDITMYHS